MKTYAVFTASSWITRVLRKKHQLRFGQTIALRKTRIGLAFLGLVHYVNQSNLLETLTIKFFVKGHTINAADSFHAAVENAMKHKGKMYDFTDFIEVINRHGISVEMYPADFKEFRNQLSRGKDTKLSPS